MKYKRNIKYKLKILKITVYSLKTFKERRTLLTRYYDYDNVYDQWMTISIKIKIKMKTGFESLVVINEFKEYPLIRGFYLNVKILFTCILLSAYLQ
jgi:hypothetical protein